VFWRSTSTERPSASTCALAERLMAGIGIEHVTKRFGGVTAVHDLSLEIGDRRIRHLARAERPAARPRSFA